MSAATTSRAREARGERVHDILPARRPVLEAMFAPKSRAVIGATEAVGSVGRTLMENLRASEFGGEPFEVESAPNGAPRRRRGRRHRQARPAHRRARESPRLAQGRPRAERRAEARHPRLCPQMARLRSRAEGDRLHRQLAKNAQRKNHAPLLKARELGLPEGDTSTLEISG